MDLGPGKLDKADWTEFTRKIDAARINAGEQAPPWPTYEQACKAEFSLDMVDEEYSRRGRLIYATRVYRFEDGSTIARLAHRKHLSDRQYGAAGDYALAYERAQMSGRVTGAYGERSSGRASASVMPATLAAAIARGELRMLQSVVGEDWRLVEMVVIADSSVEQMGFAALPIERNRPSRRTATRTGMRILKHALNAIADHYQGMKRRRRRYATMKPATSEEREAYFERGADVDAVLAVMAEKKRREERRRAVHARQLEEAS